MIIKEIFNSNIITHLLSSGLCTNCTTVGFGFSPNLHRCSRTKAEKTAITASRVSHPALKTFHDSIVICSITSLLLFVYYSAHNSFRNSLTVFQLKLYILTLPLHKPLVLITKSDVFEEHCFVLKRMICLQKIIAILNKGIG